MNQPHLQTLPTKRPKPPSQYVQRYENTVRENDEIRSATVELLAVLAAAQDHYSERMTAIWDRFHPKNGRA